MACPGLGRPVRWCWTVPYAGSEIVALLTYGQFTARTLPVSGLSTAVNPGGASPLTLHTVARPPPDAFPLIASNPLQCRAVGARDPGQIEHSWNPRGTKHCGSDGTHDVRFKMLVPGVAGPMMGEAGVTRQARGWLPGVLARSPAVALSGVGAGWWGRRKLDLGFRIARISSAGPKFGLS